MAHKGLSAVRAAVENEALCKTANKSADYYIEKYLQFGEEISNNCHNSNYAENEENFLA